MPTVTINGLTLAHQGSGGTAQSTTPDVCNTPSPSGQTPVPYTNLAKTADLVGGTQTAFFDGGMPAAVKGSKLTPSRGNEAGVGGGVTSGVNAGEAEFTSYSPNVFFEGKEACRLSDKLSMNKGNTSCMGGHLEESSPKEEEEGKDAKGKLKILAVEGPEEAEVGETATYRVTSFSRGPKTAEKKSIQWAIQVGQEPIKTLQSTGVKIQLRIKEKYWPQELTVMPYLPPNKYSEKLRISTKTGKNYLARLRHLIDKGTTDIDDLFKGLCDWYHQNSVTWKAKDDSTEIITAFRDLLGVNRKDLSKKDQQRRDQVVKKLRSGKKFFSIDQQGRTSQADKVQHFFAGAWISANLGEIAGWTAAWAVEKWDTLKATWGELTGTRQAHHVGFDWNDFEWTAAGARFAEILDEFEEENCKKLIQVFAESVLKVSEIYKPLNLGVGYGEFSPAVSPFVETKVDLVKNRVLEMENLLRKHLFLSEFPYKKILNPPNF